MKIILTLILLVSLKARASEVNEGIISVGSYGACALDERGVTCWGSKPDVYNSPPPKVPELHNVRMLDMAQDGACALDDSGVKCWGDNFNYYTKPALVDPQKISVGFGDVCVLDENKVKCWGPTKEQLNSPPAMKNIREIGVGGSQACAIDDNGVQCWGTHYPLLLQVPQLRNPKSLSVGENVACVIDGNEVTCWGYPTLARSFTLKNPRQVSAGSYHVCALDDTGVVCWGEPPGVEVSGFNIPHLKNPRAISSGLYQTCALDDDGVKCWGVSSYVSNIPPLMMPVYLTIDRLGPYLHGVKRRANPVRAKFFSLAQDYADKELVVSAKKTQAEVDSATYLMLGLLSPVILSMDSSYAIAKIIPHFQERVERINKVFGFKNLKEGVERTPSTPLNLQVALKSLQIALEIGSEFLPPEDREDIQEVLRLIGHSSSDPGDKVKIAAVAKSKRLESIAKKLSTSKNTFLFELITQATQWLGSAGGDHAS